MTIYSASSIAAVTISPEGHGGCGNTHSRPAPGGKPVAVWELQCPPCENHLRHDPMWSATIEEIPETWDEKLSRENFEKRGAKDKDAILTLALAKLAGIHSSELPESLTRMVSGVPAHIPGTIECPQGHAQPSGMKFCGECGAPMHGVPDGHALTAPPGNPPEPQDEPAPPAPRPSGGRTIRLRDGRKDDLAAFARSRGIDDGGTQAELVTRITDAGLTSRQFSDFVTTLVPA